MTVNVFFSPGGQVDDARHGQGSGVANYDGKYKL
jgi:hypothetical protein